ncbi:2-phospho-L-lactate guanylyltransferase [Paenarthrobacter nicotinovorans]|uniref:2-phospho-L-lactate guanylyltransferase n=1 Tax=Paenarthrobacter nicotinovorans TaxID=29320 RepID=UPI00382AAB6F
MEEYPESKSEEARTTDLAWTIVIPFKAGSKAKSRLARSTDGFVVQSDLRLQLANAFLLDTLAAATELNQVREVVVVSPNAEIDLGAKVHFVCDPGLGLNAAVAAGIGHARSSYPLGSVAVLTSDLPCLLPHELDRALRQAEERDLAHVPDRAGTGTTLLTASAGKPVAPKFGPQSSIRHGEAGHYPLRVPLTSGLRGDVDTLHDLAVARRRGLGPQTTGILLTNPPLSQWLADLEDQSPPASPASCLINTKLPAPFTPEEKNVQLVSLYP